MIQMHNTKFIKWAMSPLYDGADIPRRTFNNWKEAIQQAFDINIECRRVGGYHYYIENPEDLENSTTRSWLLNTFTVKNIISESKGIRDRILLENVPSGQKHLAPIIDAMQSNKWLEIVHGSYWYDRPDTYTVQPWCLKLFNQRWYVCGYCRERDAMRTFALDRIRARKRQPPIPTKNVLSSNTGSGPPGTSTAPFSPAWTR